MAEHDAETDNDVVECEQAPRDDKRVDMKDVTIARMKCPADKTMIAVRDQKARGLELRITAASKAWRFLYTRKSDGKRRAAHLGHYGQGEGYLSLGDARARVAELRRDVKAGGDPAGGVQARKVAETFAELAEKWCANAGSAERAHKERQTQPRAAISARSADRT